MPVYTMYILWIKNIEIEISYWQSFFNKQFTKENTIFLTPLLAELENMWPADLFNSVNYILPVQWGCNTKINDFIWG